MPCYGGALLSGAVIAAAETTSTQVEINGTIKATCSLTVPPPIDLGEIPISALDDRNGKAGPNNYAKTFKIVTSCSGTDKYTLDLRAEKTTPGGCLEAETQALAFCLYRDDKQINLADEASRKLTGNTSTGGETLKVVPARGRQKPTPGMHTGTMTATIAPL
ncbi:spore coat protein U domain-containing protein [Yersinia kristensenii]|uniref:spore coat protein U domain-containing protein n=1 Tax=Yersinia kristensenii TaxID=28152 RepID=UPI001C60B329|nr:spore coat protein U domain-containing protein [Yersinia kristensenii]MBW5841551.1 spore coat protein U domain-containing protein [Yersinia kristensenii]